MKEKEEGYRDKDWESMEKSGQLATLFLQIVDFFVMLGYSQPDFLTGRTEG